MSGISVAIILGAIALSAFMVLFLVLPSARDEGVDSGDSKGLIKNLPKTVNALVGVYLTSVGFMMLVVWIGYLLRSQIPLQMKDGGVILHILLMAASACVFIVAGFFQIRAWRLRHTLFYSCVALSSFSILFAFVELGNTGHPMVMNVIALLVTTVMTYFVALTYTFLHFVLRWEDSK